MGVRGRAGKREGKGVRVGEEERGGTRQLATKLGEVFFFYLHFLSLLCVFCLLSFPYSFRFLFHFECPLHFILSLSLPLPLPLPFLLCITSFLLSLRYNFHSFTLPNGAPYPSCVVLDIKVFTKLILKGLSFPSSEISLIMSIVLLAQNLIFFIREADEL